MEFNLDPKHVALLAVVLTLVAALAYRRKRYLNLPPGPPANWLWGTQFPSHTWRYYHKIGKEYGPIATLWAGRTPMIVITGYHEAIELMEKRAGSFPDRPANPVGGTLSGNSRTLFLRYGPRWRKFRKTLHLRLQPRMAENFQPYQAIAARKFVLDCQKDPIRFQEHGKTYSASVVSTLAYGKITPTPFQDPAVRKVDACFERMGKATAPNQYLMDAFPWLQYVPGYMHIFKVWHKEETELFASQLEEAQKRMNTNQVVDSFASTLADNVTTHDLNRTEKAYLAGSLFGAGSQTTYAAIANWVLAGVMHPEAQAYIHEELDRVVGRDRIPAFSDWPQLIHLEAFRLESYRWRPVNTDGTMHAAIEDVAYGGYVIPKGAIVIAPHWSVHRDPAVFPDPETFNHQRWITEKGTITQAFRQFQFGFGRRACPASQIANQSAFITIAYTMWAVKLVRKKDANGNVIPIDTTAYSSSANPQPDYFPVEFEERFPGAIDMLVAAQLL